MRGTDRPFRIDDIKQLTDVVGEHAEAVHPGLKVLETRVMLGGASVDLLALDGDQLLVLLILGFTGDDDMLMRGLEAYSWCLEYPDALTKLYPIAALSPAAPPLVIFVAERLPDAFLRKVKHLRLPRVTCLEFRFGLQFLPVEGLRGSEDRPASPPRVPESAPAQAPTTAVPAPWREREAPARPAVEPDERKATAVREYLQREFPTAVIYDFHEHERAARVFLLQDHQGSVVHQAAVAEDVLGDHSEAELTAFFDRNKLARVLRQAGQAAVSVTRSGLKVERR